MQETGGKGSSSDHEPACILRKNAQTKSRQCRGKEEESDTACCIGTPEHCGLIRRDLVVCPPFWLLPRIETGDSFLWACCAPLLRPHPQGNVPAWALRGEPFGGYGGCPFRSPGVHPYYARQSWQFFVVNLNSLQIMQFALIMPEQHPQTAYRKDDVLTGTVFENCDKRTAHEKRLLKSPHPSAV